MVYPLQGRAITTRRQYGLGNIGMLPTYYPKRTEGAIPAISAEQPLSYEEARQLYVDQPLATKRFPGNKLPGGIGVSAGLREGFSNNSVFATVNSLNVAGNQFGKGQYGGGNVPATGKGQYGGGNVPANSGSAIPSEAGIPGLSDPIGLEGSIDLADLSIGGFGDDEGLGGGDYGASGLGMDEDEEIG